MSQPPQQLLAHDLVGFPAAQPEQEPHAHGWFYPPHRVVLDCLLSAETTTVIELGSWLGRSTTFIAQHAPNAVVYAVDFWSNEVMLADTHYTDASDASVGGSGGQYRSTGVDTNLALLHERPLYETFLANMWELRYDAERGAGVVPLRMSTLDGLRLLAEHGVSPQVIYIDADHHYAGCHADVQLCMELFPEAVLVGDDWDYVDVRRAVTELGDAAGRTVHAEGNKCWTFGALEPAQLSAARARYLGREPTREEASAYRDLASSFDDDDAGRLGRLLCTRYIDFPLELGSTEKRFKGRSLLIQASQRGARDCVRALLQRFGADPNAVASQSQETALHAAAYGGYLDVVKQLLAAGTDPGKLNGYGETAERCAQANTRSTRAQRVAEYLRSRDGAGAGGGAGAGAGAGAGGDGAGGDAKRARVE